MVPRRLELGRHVDEGFGRVSQGRSTLPSEENWIIRFDKDFVSARKQQKLRRAKLQELGVNTEPDFRDDLDAYEATWYGMDPNYEDRVI